MSTNYYDFVTAEINLDCAVAHLDENWGRFDALREKYGPEVTVHDPGFLGAVMVSSNAPERTGGDLVAEFGIELLVRLAPPRLARPRNCAYR